MAERRGMENDIERVLFTEEELKRRVKELGGQLTRDFADKDPVFVGVLDRIRNNTAGVTQVIKTQTILILINQF